jgi:L-ascorbate metabolism protein UlaG (beta-lactamase superfamily)
MLTVITGPPCSGKSTYARQHAQPGDITIDFDHLAQALGSPVTHGHDDHIARTTSAAWRAAYMAAIDQHRKGHHVWLIDTTPTPARASQYRNAGARIVPLTATPGELHRRADQGRPPTWHARIDQWIADHIESPSQLEQRTIW